MNVPRRVTRAVARHQPALLPSARRDRQRERCHVIVVWIDLHLEVVAEIAALSDEDCIDPAPNGVVGRRIVSVDEARTLLSPLESRVLEAALTLRKEV